MKLKTLKDLCSDCGTTCRTKNKVRQEAIKWVKDMKFLSRSDWIDFFNITEEELK